MKKCFFLLALLFLGNFVSAVPGIPHQFYGYVNFTNAPAPDGIIVEAKIDNEVVASTITLNGRYGYKPKLFFVTDPNNNRAGKTIKFFVNGIDTNVSAIFSNGKSERIDFNINGEVGSMSVGEDENVANKEIFISPESPFTINFGDSVSITVSSNSATTATINEIRKLSNDFFSGVYAVPGGNNVLNAYEINIAGDVNITITMHYDDTGIDEASVQPYRFNGTSWVAIPYISKDTQANTITFSVEGAHTPYALFGSNIQPTPTPAGPTGGVAGGAGGALPAIGEEGEETPSSESPTPEETPVEETEETPGGEVTEAPEETPVEEGQVPEEVTAEEGAKTPAPTPTSSPAMPAAPVPPTGFFGLGVIGDIIGGILILIIIAGTFAYVRFSRKKSA